MWHSNKFLRDCEQLKRSGLAPVFEQGAHIARGFADLGYEEFVMLSDTKMISLYSGKMAELPVDHQIHFFLVPTADEVTERITELGAKVLNISSIEGRSWSVQILTTNGTEKTFHEKSIVQSLILAYANLRGLED